MPRKRQYLIRGSLDKCISHMLTNWTAINCEFLSIIYHESGKYYCLVNDEFLDQDEYIPAVEHTRLMIRVTLKELKSLCTYYNNTQTSLDI